MPYLEALSVVASLIAKETQLHENGELTDGFSQKGDAAGGSLGRPHSTPVLLGMLEAAIRDVRLAPPSLQHCFEDAGCHHCVCL